MTQTNPPKPSGKPRECPKGCLIAFFCVLATVLLFFLGVYFLISLFTPGNYCDVDADNMTVRLLTYSGWKDLFFDDKATVMEVRLEGKEQEDIIIPDTYEGIPVIELGGSGRVQNRFQLVLTEQTMAELAGTGESRGEVSLRNCRDSVDEIIYVDCSLHLGKGIQRIAPEIYGFKWETEEGKSVLFAPRVYVECDPDNPYFYSEDGILYRSNGTVFDDFFYTGEEVQ